MIDRALSLSLNRAPVLDLPRLVMRRALVVALLALPIAFAIGFMRAGGDAEDETRAAIALAGALAQVADARRLPDDELLQTLRTLQRDGRLRHLALTLADPQGRVLIEPDRGPTAGWLAPLVRLHAMWQGDVPEGRISWPMMRADGTHWTLTFTASRDSERREAMSGLALGLVAAAVALAVLLAVLSWQVQRAFVPLQALLAGIGRLGHGEPGALATLPAMPIRELQAIAAALRRLDEAWQSAELQRRILGQKVITLQEDERERLAQELHDEFGQRLTALRVDAAWLRGKVSHDAGLARVVDGMAAQCEHIQHDIRSLLARLRPLGPGEGAAALPLGALGGLLRALVRAWSREGGAADGGLRIELLLQAHDAQGAPQPWPAEDAPPGMPRELQLAIYRITQEALTNAARHAQARQATVRLSWQPQGERGVLDWSVADDGVGLPDVERAMQRGNGLAGMRERAWAQGVELSIGPSGGDAAGGPPGGTPGLRLAARFEVMPQPLAMPAHASREMS